MIRSRAKGGFTIVELVVGIAVISILASVMIPTFTHVIRNAREVADKQTMRMLNEMLAVGEIGADDIKGYRLQSEGWELAYSYSRNESVIVDESGNIVAANEENMVGTKASDEFVRASELKKDPSGNDDNDNDPDKHDGNDHDKEGKGEWENAERVNSELSEVPSERFEGKQELYIEDSITEIPESYFAHKESLERVYIGAGITKIPKSAFEGCVKLKEVYMAGEGIEICRDAFYGCINLSKINLGKVRIIGYRAFTNCSKMSDIEINSLENMDMYAFKGCVGIKELELTRLNEMYDNSLSGCVLDKLTIRSDIEVKGEYSQDDVCKVKELILGGEDRIKIGNSLWLFIGSVVENSNNIITKIRIGKIETDEGYEGKTPFKDLPKDAQVIIEDEESYENLLKGHKTESEVFGCSPQNIIKQWL